MNIKSLLLGIITALGLVAGGLAIGVIKDELNKNKPVAAYGLVAPTGVLEVIEVFADGHSVQLSKLDPEAQQAEMAKLRKLDKDKLITIEASVEVALGCTQADEG